MNPHTLYLYRLSLFCLEILAFLVALGTRKYHNAIFKLFFFDLAFVAVIESFGMYLFTFDKPHLWILAGNANIYFTFEFTLILFIALRLFSGSFAKRLLLLALIVYYVIWVIGLFSNGIFAIPTQNMLFGAIVSTVIFLALLIQMIGKPNISQQPLFWISIAMLIFYCCNIPYFGVLNYFAKKDSEILRQLVQILFITNYLRYSITIIAFLLLKKQPRLKPALNEYNEQ
jgi:hypothetical protein